MLARRLRPLAEITAKRIALIKPSALGDVAHSLPILNVLRDRFPAAHIAWVINKAYQPLIETHPSLNETIPFDRAALKGGTKKAIAMSMAFARELRRRRFDLVIDLQGLARSGLMTLATRARRRVGLGTAREGASLAYTDIIATPNAENQHAIDRYWLIADALGVGHLPKRFDMQVDPVCREWAMKELRDLPKPWMAFGVGARWLTKRWLPEHFARLAVNAQEQFGGTVFFIGAPDEARLADRVSELLSGPTRNWCGKTSIAQMVALLSRADLMVSNDTGPLHIAVALGRPTVAPFTCTRIAKHGPYQQSGGVETSVWCKGSYIKSCDRLECMQDLAPEKLWPKLRDLLEKCKNNSHSV